MKEPNLIVGWFSAVAVQAEAANHPFVVSPAKAARPDGLSITEL
jgi:hypothetical protein